MLTGGGFVRMVRSGNCGEAVGEIGLEVVVFGGVWRGVGACWKDTRLEDFLSESSVDPPSYVADALMREGRAGRTVKGERGLYRSEGGTFSCGSGLCVLVRYSDMGMFVGTVLGCSSMEPSFPTSVAIDILSFSTEFWDRSSSTWSICFAVWSGRIWLISPLDQGELLA